MKNKINFNCITDQRGSLISLEAMRNVPFEIKRVYYIFDLNEEPRGFHAHKELKQVFVCLNGSCSIKLDNGTETTVFNLKNPREGIFIDNMTWREMFNFSKDCVCMVLASDYYNENDYIRDYKEFISEISKNAQT